jgi:phosphoserine phosphatase RsbU/P
MKEVNDHHLELQKELERAHNMQRDLLPSRETERVLERAYNIRLTSHYEPSSQLGGDIWGVQLISNNRFMFYLVDFSGHGVSAALNTFRLHSRIESEPIADQRPGEYLESLNLWLCDHLATGQYATTLLGVVDFEEQTFEYAAAGSTAPMRVNSKSQSVEIGSGKGLPLGVSKKAAYENRSFRFCPGDGIFLYSDALVEHGRKDHMDLGRDGVEQLLLNVADMSSDLIVDDILAPFLAMAPRPLSDDLTAVCCVWKVVS